MTIPRPVLWLITVMIILAPLTPKAGTIGSSPTGKGMELMMVEEAGCVWCAKWEKEIGPIYPKTEEGKRAPLKKIDKHSTLPANIRAERAFFFTPTFVLLVDGMEKGRIEGYPGEDFFWALLAQLITSVDKTSPPEFEQKHENQAR